MSIWQVSDTCKYLIPDYRVIKAEPPPAPQTPGNLLTATVQLHWCQTNSTVAYSESLAYCATLGGAFDDVTIIDHFVR